MTDLETVAYAVAAVPLLADGQLIILYYDGYRQGSKIKEIRDKLTVGIESRVRNGTIEDWDCEAYASAFEAAAVAAKDLGLAPDKLVMELSGDVQPDPEQMGLLSDAFQRALEAKVGGQELNAWRTLARVFTARNGEWEESNEN